MSGTSRQPGTWSGAEVDPTVAHSARMWNYWLGGKDNFEIDRHVAEEHAAKFPGIVDVARQVRAFLVRSVTLLAAEAGVRQFLDIGTGLPTANNTHEVAQRVAPECKIVYVDNDPLVLVHAQALLVGTSEGSTDYIEADVRDPGRILAEAAKTLDFTEPIGLMMLGVLGQIPDSDDPRGIVRTLVDALPSGSWVVIEDGVDTDMAQNDAIGDYNANPDSTASYHLRSIDFITSYFDGLDLLAPGVVSCSRWRPDIRALAAPEVPDYAGVARKP
ncbi:SAM-dependent methyltransferase [Actinocorallia sp. A-T 12471]|uniref:SAM-dependent methyltransferase n=1 Tax=Actinocorallia sp. A-T 12471 TaxID=3089813 RepID=UPI0029CE0F2E|nr:SAM-dependent methyltransferase [Actinocorallia sp. A-T 12471]MDX6741983.1 SAM-dependent methyltransferase [Actinocorallia sp. A-T 12471]